jgi:hypothetical protein
MSSSLGARIFSEQNRCFVGRMEELELFQDALVSTELPFNILYIFGPGGVGKTSLKDQFICLCQELNIQYINVEARNIEPVPESFLSTLRSIMSLQSTECPLQILAANNERNVIFIDTYEVMAPLDTWLRQEVLLQLSVNTLVVLIGRNSPSEAWRSDPGWQALIRTLPLRNLSREESIAYLTKRNIPVTQHSSILDFTYGHPLALSLVVHVFSQGQSISFETNSAPDIIKTLLERFIKKVPTHVHRKALEASAVIRLTTESLLAHILDLPDTYDIFLWLRELSFIESGQLGLFPHDLVREVLIADLRWRNPEFYEELHNRARTYYIKRLKETQGQEKHCVLFDYLFLHRDNLAIRSRFTWQEHSSLLTDSCHESDKHAILEIVAQYEGEESAKIAAHWMTRQPQNVLVFRDSHPTPAGFAIMVALHEATQEDLNADPGAIVCWRYLENHSPLRQSEGATIFRFWMARDTYQATSPVQSLIFINFVQYFQKTLGLAYTLLPCAAPDIWAPLLIYFDMTRLPQADFVVGGRCYSVYGHDWRVVTPLLWQELLAKREVTAQSESLSATPISQPVLVLSQAAFVEAVQDALRNFTRLDLLRKNPLIYSRFVENTVAGKGSITERITTLQTLIKQAAEFLQSSPREEKLYRVLYRTYINPALTQEQAAELLDLPFSTYRRHLKAGIARLANILWEKEIN